MFEVIPSFEPIWPLTAVVHAAALVIALTLGAYLGTRHARPRRLAALLALRLAALAVAAVVVLQPSWSYTEVIKHPATVVILVDGSKSMLIRDEDPNQTRWEAFLRDWEAAASFLRALERDHAVQVVVYQFDARLREFRPEALPDGEQTAVLQALSLAAEQHKPFDRAKDAPLRGIIVISDGQDNVGKPALESVLGKLNAVPCPVYTIGFGSAGESRRQPDLIALNIEAPQTARIKDRLLVRGTIQTQQFVGQEFEVKLLIDGQPVKQADDPTQDVAIRLRPETATQVFPIELPAYRLPEQPGDLRVSLRITPLPGELTETNNEVSTYVTVSKEGLSVLYFDKVRPWEPRELKRALDGDERITLYTDFLPGDPGPEAAAWRRKVFENLQNNTYDVFIFGDRSADWFTPGPGEDFDILKTLAAAVDQRGAGLVMIGGQHSFADGGWQKTPLAPLLPVMLDQKGQLEGGLGQPREIKIALTKDGAQHFVLRLDSDPQRNAAWWARLPPLEGGNKLGTLKPGAVDLARTPEGQLLLAVQDYGKGRTAALAVDTTWKWVRGDPDKPHELSASREAHLRFWRQLILWLAKQEEANKSLRVELDHRRLPAGREQGITVQARELTPGGKADASKPLKGAEFTVTVIKPDKTEEPVTVSPEGTEEHTSRGTFTRTQEPGEYEVVVTARYQGTDLGMVKARFMTYRDDSEMLNRAANHALLERLARSTGGAHRLHGGLRELLELLKPNVATQTERVTKYPDWEEPEPARQTILLLLFIGLICTEWLLRRLWGMV